MMKYVFLIIFLLVLNLFGAEKATAWEVNGRLDMYVQSIDVQGGTSSDREGSTHNEEVNLNFFGPLFDGEAGVQSRFRTTNDKRIQKDGAELLYLRSYFKNKLWELEVGDVAAPFNPYIFGGSVKGLKAVYKSSEKANTWNYAFISGFKKSAWRQTYTSESGEEPTGYAGAFEAKYIHESAKEIALSVALYKDDLSTGDTNTTLLGKKGFGIGLDGKWRFNKYITLSGRGAITRGSDDLENDKDSQTSNAVLIKLLTRPILTSLRSDFTYQRVDSDFISFGGSANSDKEQIENSTTWTINKEFRARVDLKANWDNLNGALEDTQYLYYEAIALTYTPEFLKRGDINFRFANKDVDGRGAKNNTRTAGIDINMRDSSGWRYGGGYDYNDFDDTILASASQKTHTLRALLGYKASLGEEKSYRFTIRPDYQLIENAQDKIGLKIDAGYTHDKRLSADFIYMINQTDYEANDNNTQNSTYQFVSTYKLDAKGQNLLRLLLEKRDVDVENTPNNSYNEYIGKVSLVMNF
ncbi:MAG: hypothetical protein IE909_06430 [Campylobacterales bacterium]|nr:hypothetical protein [Campylobacterales bacterium]